MASILQDWVQQLHFMQQSVLLTAVRGPDGIAAESTVKPILRWYRRCILISSLDQEVLTTPCDLRGGKFTGPSYTVSDEISKMYDEHYLKSVNNAENPKPRDVFEREVVNDLVNSWPVTMQRYTKMFMDTIDQYPHHFIQHLKDAAQILGYKHPDEKIRGFWNKFYRDYCKEIAVVPEDMEFMDKRLNDFRNKKAPNEQQTAN